MELEFRKDRLQPIQLLFFQQLQGYPFLRRKSERDSVKENSESVWDSGNENMRIYKVGVWGLVR